MKIFLISNNLVLEDILYNTDLTVEEKRINRPLSIEGEELSKKLAKKLDVGAIYSSDYASALATAKYLSKKLDLTINIDSNLRDSKIGELKNRNIKMLRFMQEREFNYKFVGGESINETKARMKKVIDKIIRTNSCDIAIFTHKRAILSYLLDYTNEGFNLDDRLILSYNDSVIIDDSEKDMEVICIEYDNKKIVNITSGDLSHE